MCTCAVYLVFHVETGPILGESYVLLPTSISPRAMQQASSMLLLDESAMGFMGDAFGDASSSITGGGYDYYASGSQNGPVMSDQRVQEQYFDADQQRQSPSRKSSDTSTPAPGGRRNNNSANVSANAYRDKPSSLGESINAGVVAHADLSHQVQLITTHHAHWYAAKLIPSSLCVFL